MMANGERRNGSIPSSWIPAIVFVIAQTGTGVWWASKTSSAIEHLTQIVPSISVQMADNSKEIQRLGNMLGEHHGIKETIKGLDVLRYKVDALVKDMNRIKERNVAIEEQHTSLFQALQGPQQAVQTKSYNYE
jgi:hypothetical protein